MFSFFSEVFPTICLEDLKMQGKFYSVLVKACVFLRFVTFFWAFLSLSLQVWQFNDDPLVNEAFFGEIYAFFFGQCILA